MDPYQKITFVTHTNCVASFKPLSKSAQKGLSSLTMRVQVPQPCSRMMNTLPANLNEHQQSQVLEFHNQRGKFQEACTLNEGKGYNFTINKPLDIPSSPST